MIISDIVCQHAEEASFLWLLREAAAGQPHYSLRDLAELDDRLDAHIDALRISGEAGWEICQESFGMEEAGEVFVAAIVAFHGGRQQQIQAVLEIGAADAGLARGLVSAFGWLGWQLTDKYIRSCIDSDSLTLRGIGLAASVVQRRNPGNVLIDNLSCDNLLLRGRALKAIGELGRQDLLSLLQEDLPIVDQKCRFNGALSTLLLGGNGAIPVLRDIAERGNEYSERACALALRGMKLQDGHAWLRELSQKKESVRLAVQGAGVAGDPVSIPWLIEVMEIPECARLAGESISMITGVDLAYENLETDWPEGFQTGPTEEPEDDDVAMDADEDLPWPDPELVANWWHGKKDDFRVGSRYLVGKPISADHLQQVLRTGYQRQRAAAALELALLQPGTPLFEVRAPGFRQMKKLGFK